MSNKLSDNLTNVQSINHYKTCFPLIIMRFNKKLCIKYIQKIIWSFSIFYEYLLLGLQFIISIKH